MDAVDGGRPAQGAQPVRAATTGPRPARPGRAQDPGSGPAPAGLRLRSKKRRGANREASGPLTRPARRRGLEALPAKGVSVHCALKRRGPIVSSPGWSPVLADHRPRISPCEGEAVSGGARLVRPYSLASSPSSLSVSSSPARILSAIRPEFCRTAASIDAAISGLLRRKVLAFSRPCPIRCES
jgi:hypothetical protein